MEKSKNRFERVILKIKNNKVVTIVIFIGTIVVGISTFTNAARNLLDLFVVENRPAINGEWKADVTYDWPNALYAETFTLSGDGNNVYGIASFLGVGRGILEGVTQGNEVLFITNSQEGSDSPQHQVHRYRGKIISDEIWFVMQTEGGFSEHVPIKFVARRVSSNLAE